MFSSDRLSGPTFERLIFGASTEGVPDYFSESGTFSGNIWHIINHSKKMEYPNTTFGKGLYFRVVKNLEKRGIHFSDLRLLSAVGRKADIFHETDGFIYFECAGYECVVTIDVFYIDPNEEEKQINFWIEKSAHNIYTSREMQSDYFRYKKIVSKKLNENEFKLGILPDVWFGRLASDRYEKEWVSGYIPDPLYKDRPRNRPENHLILTPYYLLNDQRREIFANLVVESIAKQIEEHRKEALAGT